eukprot:85009-Chlamydomonas_euryale.AAC.1
MWRAPVCARVARGGGACGVGVVGRAAIGATPASVEECREAWASGRGRRQRDFLGGKCAVGLALLSPVCDLFGSFGASTDFSNDDWLESVAARAGGAGVDRSAGAECRQSAGRPAGCPPHSGRPERA